MNTEEITAELSKFTTTQIVHEVLRRVVAEEAVGPESPKIELATDTK